MIGWILYGRKEAEYNKHYITMYQEEGKKFDITFELIIVEELEFGVRNNTWYVEYQDEEVKLPTFVISRVIYPLLTRQLEYMKVPVFNGSEVARICNDKASTYQAVTALGELQKQLLKPLMAMEDGKCIWWILTIHNK